MPNTPPPLSHCSNCRCCRNCDPTPGQSPQRPRVCPHNQRWTYIVPNTMAAANHRCPARTSPLGGSTTLGYQFGHPQAAPYLQNPQAQVAQMHAGAIPAYVYRDNYAGQNARVQYGSRYAEQPLVETPTLYERNVARGHASVLAGHIYERANPAANSLGAHRSSENPRPNY